MRLINSDGVEEAHQVAASDYDFAALKFRIILTLRYANYRLLLHRPILVRFLDACGGSQSDPQQLQLLHQLGLSSMQICADSTMQIIDLVYDIVHRSDKLPNLLGAWWFSLYYSMSVLFSCIPGGHTYPFILKLLTGDYPAFNAALVILGILIVCREGSMSGQLASGVVDKIRKYPFHAVAALLKLDTGNRMVDRCRLYLERLISSSGLYGELAVLIAVYSEISLTDRNRHR